MQLLRAPGWLRIAVAGMLALVAVVAVRVFHLGAPFGGQEPIRGWMTVPYVAHARHVRQDVLWSALGIPAHLHDHRSIARIAHQQGRPVADVISSLRSAIDRTVDAEAR